MKLILALFCLSFSAQTLANEVCYDPSNTIKAVINDRRDEKILSIEFYQNDKLIVRDLGQDGLGFVRSFCHVSGEVQTGKFFSYGGCGSSEERVPKKLTFRNSDESYDLKEFSCHPLVSQEVKPPQACCNPCQEIASPGSCGGLPSCPHHTCH